MFLLMIAIALALMNMSFAAEPPAERGKVAPKPLYRDPIHDGAADPVVVWNRAEKKWFIFYTNRRANVLGLEGVEWCHGSKIGIAESTDGGATWTYRGTADIPYGQEPCSHWAPDVIWNDGQYHMFLTFVPGMHKDWSGTREIVHLTSDDLIHWRDPRPLKLRSDRVIDAGLARLPDGTWRMWYNNEPDHKSIYAVDSADGFRTWTDAGKILGDQPGEGPKVFKWKDRYWALVDVWDGVAVYRSDDAMNWTRQAQNLVQGGGTGADDNVEGRHPDVVVNNGRAYMFYFTHPGRVPEHKGDAYQDRRTSIQVVELQEQDGILTCDRNAPTQINLIPPAD